MRGAVAGDIQLEWDPVPDSRVARYEVHYGPASGQYESQVAATSTTVALAGLQPGQTYYFAARACAQDETTCSAFSNEVSATVAYPAPVAGLAADVVVGTAPLTVSFADRSTGLVAGWNWQFGDDTGATVQSPRHTYTAAGTYSVTLTVTGPGGTSGTTQTGYIQVLTPPPVADFVASTLSGFAPLTTTFSDLSSGAISTRSWAFGDGGTSTAATAVYTYTVPGTYAVSLRVSGPGGEDTEVKTAFITVNADRLNIPLEPPAPVEPPELPMEVGEVLVNSTWQRVTFKTPFADPIMVAKSLSSNDAAAAVVRVKGVDASGFWIRVQEWGYLDGVHATEAVSYMVMERGYHQLSNGALVEAGRLTTSTAKTRTPTFVRRTFSAPFTVVPVVFAAVTSSNEQDAVDTRVRNIAVKGFDVGMQEQESSNQAHQPETIDFIAWEPSFGVVNGLRYEVGFTDAKVTNKVSTFLYHSVFARPPLFLAGMQTTANTDTANLRWRNRNEVAVDVWVSEEQSRDTEVTHPAESVGYFVADEEQ